LRSVQSSKGIGEPPLFLGSTVFFALREAVRSARQMNGKGIDIDTGSGEGEKVSRMWNMDSPATSERLRLAVGDDLVERAKVKKAAGENNFFVAVA
jgi:xanthine dehydrogenase/oxidase